MKRALFAPAGEVGADTHRTIESRIERGVAAIDFGAVARIEHVDYAVTPIAMDVRQRRGAA